MKIRDNLASGMCRIALAVLILIPVIPATITAQNRGEELAEIGPELVIRDITWEIDGRTRLWVLRNLLDLEEGLRFSSEEELVEFLLEEQQILINQRELHTSTISFTLEEPAPEAHPEEIAEQPVSVHVYVKDTWNIIALPYARYDSNEGLLLSIRARDYNFFGTLQDLRIDLDYEFTDDEENVVTLSADFSLPFEMLRRQWALIMKQSLAVQDGDVDFRLGLGLEYYFGWAGMDWTAGVMQEYRYLSDDEYDDGYYLGNRFSLGSSLNTPATLPLFGRLRYAPEVYSTVNYRPGGISEERKGVAVGFDQRLLAGRFNWVGNYRDGQTFRVGNDNEYNIETDTWQKELYGEIAIFRKLWHPDPERFPRAGVSGRVVSFYLLDGAPEDQDNAARHARGILNDRMNGDLGVFLNLDISVTLWTLRPIFEMQIGTFFDVAYVADTRGDFYESTSFERERDLKFGSGIAVIGFPLFARSLFVRGSYGVDLDLVRKGMSPLDGRAREIFIGLGHYY
ncbi:MAG: hypothetical protein EA427_04810 [Spirochaetaceae bacterium]|nr:MAG: hypothetical protein EA427_04810 [Spirochaetaceae bacterium]